MADGSLVKDFIVALELSQAAFAREIGIAPAYVSQVISGRDCFGAAVVLRIYQVFGDEMEELGLGPEDFLAVNR